MEHQGARDLGQTYILCSTPFPLYHMANTLRSIQLSRFRCHSKNNRSINRHFSGRNLLQDKIITPSSEESWLPDAGSAVSPRRKPTKIHTPDIRLHHRPLSFQRHISCHELELFILTKTDRSSLQQGDYIIFYENF